MAYIIRVLAARIWMGKPRSVNSIHSIVLIVLDDGYH